MRQVARREYAAKVDNRAVNANGEVLLVASALFPLKGVGGGTRLMYSNDKKGPPLNLARLYLCGQLEGPDSFFLFVIRRMKGTSFLVQERFINVKMRNQRGPGSWLGSLFVAMTRSAFELL